MSDQFDKLVAVMRTLRSPEGCPWDREQTLESLTHFVLEEAYEVVDAIERGDTAALKEEIGDHIFEGVFLAQVAQRASVGVTGDGGLLQDVEPADFVEPHDVIRVAVGIDDGVHAFHVVGQRLRAQIRRRVDEKRRTVPYFNEHRRTKPAVARIGGPAGAAFAPDHGHAVGRARPQHKHPCGRLGRVRQGVMILFS